MENRKRWIEERRGRQKKRWGYNIKERTGLEFANSQRPAVENRKDEESWLQSPQWCPNDPYGLRESEVK